MFVAHAPAAWLLGRAFARRRALIVACVVGGVAPDVDMVFWLLDGGRVHHHAYPTHWPLTWLVVVGAGLLARLVSRAGRPSVLACTLAVAPSMRVCSGMAKLVVAFGAGALLHVVLDTVAGDVRWLAPFDARAFSLVTVPATQSHWILSFVLHWTFLVELAVCAIAITLFARRPTRSTPTPSTATRSKPTRSKSAAREAPRPDAERV